MTDRYKYVRAGRNAPLVMAKAVCEIGADLLSRVAAFIEGRIW